MKLYITFLILIGAFSESSFAQSANAEQLANKIAQKMKDTLSLSDAQKHNCIQSICNCINKRWSCVNYTKEATL